MSNRNSLINNFSLKKLNLWLAIVASFYLFPIAIYSQNAKDPENKKNSLDDAAAKLPETQAAKVDRLFGKQIADDAERRLLFYRELVADGHTTRATQYLKDFLLIYPVHSRRFEIQELLGQAHLRNGQPEPAADAFMQAWQSAPNEDRGLKAYLQAGRILADAGRIGRARSIFKNVLQIRPSSALSKMAELELSSFPMLASPTDTILGPKKTSDPENNQVNKTTETNTEVPLINDNDNSARSDETLKKADKLEPVSDTNIAGDSTETKTQKEKSLNENKKAATNKRGGLSGNNVGQGIYQN